MNSQQDIATSASLPRTAHRGHRIAAAVCTLFAAVAIAPNLLAQAPPRPRKSPTPPRYETIPKSNTSLPAGIGPITTKPAPHPLQGKILDPHKVPPQIGPGPIEHNASASSTHGSTAVGGNSQTRIDNGKAALNPQPIPPGKPKAETLQERKHRKHGKYDLSKNKES